MVFSQYASKISGHKKETTNHMRVILLPYAANKAIVLNFGMRSDIFADVNQPH